MAMRLAVIFAFLATAWASNETTTTADPADPANATTVAPSAVDAAPRQAEMMAPVCAVAGLVTYSLM